MQKITHAITIREPFAWLVTAGFKLAEIRSVRFPKNHSLPFWVAVHASLSHENLQDQDLVFDLAEAHPEILECWDGEDFGRQFGVSEIVGAARIVASVPGENPTEEQSAAVRNAYENRSERCRIEGWEPEEFLQDEANNWIIDDVYRFAQPIVCGGNLNVWSLQPGLVDLVNVQFANTIKTGGRKRREPSGKPIIFSTPKMSLKRQRDLGWVDSPPTST